MCQKKKNEKMRRKLSFPFVIVRVRRYRYEYIYRMACSYMAYLKWRILRQDKTRKCCHSAHILFESLLLQHRGKKGWRPISQRSRPTSNSSNCLISFSPLHAWIIRQNFRPGERINRSKNWCYSNMSTIEGGKRVKSVSQSLSECALDSQGWQLLLQLRLPSSL